ncbi:electron transfer flavoprotein subunit alpha/FixB family protein [Melioribacter sp. OK-6-Me]|uniref:electron transfer flavoprotein subunit alpha/FixB family protein n=1 Tax=unclassified Melioribacter TaxID=2627329 RepID=UPI003EDA2C66
MANKILVFLEQRDGQIKKSSYEVSVAAWKLSKDLNAEVEGVVIGSEVENPDFAGNYGLSKVYHIKNEQLANYSSSAYTDSLLDLIKSIDAQIIIFSATSMGRDLAPRIAAKLDCGIVNDVIDWKVDNGEIIATRPVYAGKALTDVKIKSDKKIFTLRPNVFKAEKITEQAATIEVKGVENPNIRTKVVEIIKSDTKLDVAEADIIVSGGRGMKAPENFKLVEELAELLGAATGASRAVVDAGWRPHGEQVGQTGKTVSPTLYIALGISGAIQHLAGMRSSKYIVAINKDKDAPIFQIADYGIVGDLFEIVPAMIEEIKKIKNS